MSNATLLEPTLDPNAGRVKKASTAAEGSFFLWDVRAGWAGTFKGTKGRNQNYTTVEPSLRACMKIPALIIKSPVSFQQQELAEG